MIDRVKAVLRLLKAVVRILPVVLEVMQDFADDGKRNHSTRSTVGKADSAPAKS